MGCGVMSPNFAHLRHYDEPLFRLGSLAERYIPDDPNTSLLKLRRLESEGVLEREVANHDLQGDHATALKILRVAWQLGVPPGGARRSAHAV